MRKQQKCTTPPCLLLNTRKKMGLWDILKSAAHAVGQAVANPIQTATALLTSPVKLIHRIESAANTMDEMPQSMRELISEKGEMPIKQIVVFREPVNTAVKLAAIVVTGGSLTFHIRHVFEVFVLEHAGGGETFIRVEKNETVTSQEISKANFESLKESHQHISFEGPKVEALNMQLFFSNYIAKTDPKVLWVYDPATANCQVFVFLGLKANEIEVSQEQQDWIVQKEVRHQIGKISHFLMKGITTIANFGRHIIGADGSEFDDQHVDDDLVALLNAHAELRMECIAMLYHFLQTHPEIHAEIPEGTGSVLVDDGSGSVEPDAWFAIPGSLSVPKISKEKRQFPMTRQKRAREETEQQI